MACTKVSPMFPVRSVTYVPGSYQGLPNKPMKLTRSPQGHRVESRDRLGGDRAAYRQSVRRTREVKAVSLVLVRETIYDCHMKLGPALVSAALLLSSCFGSFEADRRTLPARASFDLDCPQAQLKYSELGNKSVGVSGCGKKSVYVSACNGQPGQMTTTCSWVQN
jgi:hypothetical protein